MIKIIADTNIFLGGMMGYKSPSRKILNLSMARNIEIVSCRQMIKEFSEKVIEPHVQKYWQKKYFSSEKIIKDYLSFVVRHEPRPCFMNKEIPIEDPKDAIFFQLALSASIKIIISKDHHLLKLDGYEGIKVKTPDIFIEKYENIKLH